MIITAAYVVIATVIALIWMQRRPIYFPSKVVPPPDQRDLTDVESVTFETIDGLSLSGWFFAVSGPSPRVTVLVFNGNAGNRAHRGPLAAALHRHGLQVLLVDYRGYGGNPGICVRPFAIFYREAICKLARALLRARTLATFNFCRRATGRIISAGTLNPLLAKLSLKFLRLTAQLIELVENRLEFFRRQAGHAEVDANYDSSAGRIKPVTA